MTIDAILAGASVAALPDGHFIDGAFVASADGATMESFDPGRAQPFARFAAGGAADVDAAVASARAAFKVWGRMSAAERGRVLSAAAALIRQEAERLALVECLDSGKPLREARADVAGAARAFEYYAGACGTLQGDTFPLPRNYLGYSVWEPVGVAAEIIPWNFPISTAARGFAPALAAGCAVVAKPAEQTPFTALMLAEILTRAGLPAGALNVVTGTGTAVGAPLAGHAGVDHVTFTGSVATGRAVMHAAAEHTRRLVLELGGKSPVVVLADCDMDAAVEGVLGAIFEHAGQVCSAGSRLVIERAIHAPFLEALTARARAMSIGHGLADPDLGPVASAEQLAKIAGFVDRARARGAEILTGGAITHDPKTGEGWFYEPTIVADRPVEDELVQEEIFGPVLTVQVAEDAADACRLANATRYGLVAGIYTADVTQALALARDIDAGQIFINEYFAGGVEVPFGGNKASGFGREKGVEGLKSYSKLKSVAARID